MERYRIENLKFTYPEREKPALAGVNLIVRQGEFLMLCGLSGCGKTTLLRQLKPILAPHGARSGEVFFDGTPISALDQREQSARIGFVMQSPENQIVTDKVWHELAFGPESLGAPQEEIRLRVAEMASFFGIQAWFYKNVTELSGGQKQLLNLASVMTMHPEVLLLDEPTSRLDPIAASEFLGVVGKINRELGITVILSEHRSEEVFPLCDRVAVMEEGKIVADGTPAAVGAMLRERDHGMFCAMPAPMRIWAAVDAKGARNAESPCPVTVRDGRDWLHRLAADGLRIRAREAEAAEPVSAPPAVELDDLWFRYEKNAPDVIKGLSFKAYGGTITAVLGGNGTGKTTALSLISGINKPYRGKVRIEGEALEKHAGRLFSGLLGVLPQNPQALFVQKTVEADLLEILAGAKLSKAEKRNRIARVAALCRLEGLLSAHPYDLSGGEQQRAALAKVLLLRPRILLLDEPTKGLDASFKRVCAGILKRLAAAGVAVVLVSHDLEFCAEYADSCALFFDGNIITKGAPRDFFSGNGFYTTAANRMARDKLPKAVTPEDVIAALGGEVPAPPPVLAAEDAPAYDFDAPACGDAAAHDAEAGDATARIPSANAAHAQALPAEGPRARFTPARRLAVTLATLCLIGTALFAGTHIEGLSAFVAGGDLAIHAAEGPGVWRYAGIMLALAAEAGALAFALTWKREGRPRAPLPAPGDRGSAGRTRAAAVMILLAVPLTIYVGVYFLEDRKYYFISMLILLETMLPFALVFESRRPQARELVIIAVLCAIAVAGRTAFFMLPQFKPVLALVIVAGVAFGGEAGFLVGALTGFVSNMFFGQGPWTPWQMFAFGIIGFLAGVLFRKGLLRRDRGALCVFGALSAFAVYGLIMDTSMVLMYQIRPVKEMFFAAYLQGLPFNLVHATATAFFLFVISRAMLEKLDRIKVKYGLIER
ncbi:MAG: ATP-binding cassette domain-containing protein [Clostridiales Family XIII bacterium]|nr:ATP-binding cassette domain-containing protein [Clostridiales Family XIII bacterium]